MMNSMILSNFHQSLISYFSSFVTLNHHLLMISYLIVPVVQHRYEHRSIFILVIITKLVSVAAS